MLHAACLMTRLTGVRPSVDLSWKALIYTMRHPIIITVTFLSCINKYTFYFLLTDLLFLSSHVKLSRYHVENHSEWKTELSEIRNSLHQQTCPTTDYHMLVLMDQRHGLEKIRISISGFKCLFRSLHS